MEQPFAVTGKASRGHRAGPSSAACQAGNTVTGAVPQLGYAVDGGCEVNGGEGPSKAPVTQAGRGDGGAGGGLTEAAPRRVTIREVAALAGVSIGTASKALNGQGKLRMETRDRVAQAARELGFPSNDRSPPTPEEDT